MVLKGMSLNYNGKREKLQLSDELTYIIPKYRCSFNGVPVQSWDVGIESDKDKE